MFLEPSLQAMNLEQLPEMLCALFTGGNQVCLGIRETHVERMFEMTCDAGKISTKVKFLKALKALTQVSIIILSTI